MNREHDIEVLSSPGYFPRAFFSQMHPLHELQLHGLQAKLAHGEEAVGRARALGADRYPRSPETQGVHAKAAASSREYPKTLAKDSAIFALTSSGSTQCPNSFANEVTPLSWIPQGLIREK